MEPKVIITLEEYKRLQDIEKKFSQLIENVPNISYSLNLQRLEGLKGIGFLYNKLYYCSADNLPETLNALKRVHTAETEELRTKFVLEINKRNELIKKLKNRKWYHFFKTYEDDF